MRDARERRRWLGTTRLRSACENILTAEREGVGACSRPPVFRKGGRDAARELFGPMSSRSYGAPSSGCAVSRSCRHMRDGCSVSIRNSNDDRTTPRLGAAVPRASANSRAGRGPELRSVLAYLSRPLDPLLRRITIRREGRRKHEPHDILLPEGYV